MTQTQTVDTLERMRAGYAFMASDGSGGLRDTEIGWQWHIDGTTYYMLGERQVQRLGGTALGEDAAGIVEAVKREADGVSAELYALDPDNVLRVVGLESLTKEVTRDIDALAASLHGAEPEEATEAQRAQFWGAVTWPLS